MLGTDQFDNSSDLEATILSAAVRDFHRNRTRWREREGYYERDVAGVTLRLSSRLLDMLERELVSIEAAEQDFRAGRFITNEPTKAERPDEIAPS